MDNWDVGSSGQKIRVNSAEFTSDRNGAVEAGINLRGDFFYRS